MDPQCLQDIVNDKPCRRCTSEDHAGKDCGTQGMAFYHDDCPANVSLAWSDAPKDEYRHEAEAFITRNLAAPFTYVNADTEQRVMEGTQVYRNPPPAPANLTSTPTGNARPPSTPSRSAIGATATPGLGRGGSLPSTAGTAPRPVAGPSNMALHPKPASMIKNNQKGGTTSSTTAPTPSGSSGPHPSTSRRLLRRHSLVLPAPRPGNQASSQGPPPGLPIDTRDSFKKSLEKCHAENQSSSFPLRPGFAEDNKEYTVLTNHFKMSCPKQLHRYTIGLTAACSSRPRKAREQLIKLFFEETSVLREQSFNFATDDLQMIVSPEPLRFGACDLKLKQEAVQSIPHTPTSNGDRLVFAKKVPFGITKKANGASEDKFELVAIYDQGEVDFNPLGDFVHGQAGMQDQDNSIACQSLNIVIAKAAAGVEGIHRNFQVGNNKFFLKNRWNRLDNLVVCHHGFSVTVKPGMGNMLLNVNSATSAFFEPRLVSDYIARLPPFESGSRYDLGRMLKGVRVYVNFTPGQSSTRSDDPPSRIKTIRGFGQSLDKQYFKKDGKRVSVYEHLVGTYNFPKPLRTSSFCVNLGGEQPGTELWYAPEMLQILPYQPYRMKLSAGQTDSMIRHACTLPPTKVANILGDGLSSVGFAAQTSDVLRAFSLDIEKQMLEIPARRIPDVNLVHGQSRSSKVVNGTWDFKDKKLFSTQSETKCGFHYLFSNEGWDPKVRKINPASFDEIHKEFMAALRSLGFQQLPTSKSLSVLPDLESTSISKALSDATRNKATFVILLLSKKSVPEYTNLKCLADKSGFHALCLARIPADGGKRRGYFRNVGLKLNLKLGNVNHTVKNYNSTGASAGFGQAGKTTIDGNIMILGADVTHASGASPEGTPSIAAVVGSVDGTFGKFLASMRWQEPDRLPSGKSKKSKEIITDMKSMVKERLMAYENRNKKLPTGIIYYRDGVDEAQRAKVRDEEVSAIKAAYQDMIAAKGLKKVDVPVTAVVVAKNHNTRLFPKETGKSHALPNGNVLPGTVVDSCITSPYHFDFFLVAHASIQGTAKPAHYFVVENGMAFTAQQLQDFTQKLCSIYVRANKVVSYAPPAYYADRLCDRGRLYLRDYIDGGAHLSGADAIHDINARWPRGRNFWGDALNDTMFWM